LTGSRLIICEGPIDEAFFRSLIRARGLPEFAIRNGSDRSPEASGGIDSIGSLLVGIAIWDGFSNLTEILIAADNDQTPAENFEKVRSQIARAGNYPVPSAPLQRATGTPNVTVMMIPWANERGNLETLCLGPAMGVSSVLANCVDAFAACVSVSGWPSGAKLDAMKLRSLLAASHPRNPFIGLGRVWSDAPGLIPLTDASFDRIAAFLARY
jgi:hypothetical protein